jgi:type I site-specific restriction-modification system R (restriction) subunit
MQNPTLVVLTDRNDLDDQLFGTFSMCKDLLRQTPIQAEDRDHLKKLLDRPSGGVIFTTLQKFSPEEGKTHYPVLTDRRNVIVIADEAHRGQYGLRATVARDTGDISYGFAKYLRDGLPNASFIGFTGTPIEKDDAQVIEELIQLAKDIRAARARGEETGLTDEEIAFYDALAENESARQVMGEPTLRVIAHELVIGIKDSVSVDWMHRETARARMRVLVKRLLR